MKFENLPELALARIADFLDPKSRISYLRSIQDIYQEQEKRGTPTQYHCYFCAINLWFYDLPMGLYTGDGENFNYSMRLKHEKNEIVQGADGKPYKFYRYRRRHYSNLDEELELAQFFHYFGNA